MYNNHGEVNAQMLLINNINNIKTLIKHYMLPYSLLIINVSKGKSKYFINEKTIVNM